MAQQTINVGAAPNDGTGTPLRTAFQYTNSNFSELYTAVGPSGNNIVVPGTATITGDLTVDTSTLKVDSTNDRVGIGTASPTSKLHILNTAAATRITITDDSANGRSGYIESNFSDALVIGTTSGVRAIRFSPDNKPYYQIAADGVQTWLDGIGGTRMTLNATGLGVGGSPSYKLSAVGTTNNQVVLHVGNTAGTSDGDTTNVVRFAAGSGANALWANARYDGFSHAWRCNSTTTEAMVLNSSGNVGIGVTPSAWNASYKAIQNVAGSFVGITSAESAFLHNAYVAPSGNYTYVNTAAAVRYSQAGASHLWFNAASGTAGNIITWTQAMTLDASGNLLVGTTGVNGSISNASKLVAGIFSTVNGVTASIATATPTTIFAAPAESTFIVSAYLNGVGAPTTYNAVSIVKVSNNVAAITAISTATSMTITLSGSNVQVTQSSGGNQVVTYSVTRLY